MKRLSACVVGLAGMCLATAHAASFDCRKAQRPVEKLICSDPRLNAADERLGQVYRAGLQKLLPASIGLLRVDQVQWLAWVQEVCHAPEPDSAGSPITSPAVVAACMLPLYSDRTKQLRGIAVERDGVRFLTRTQYLVVPEPGTSPGSPEFRGFGTLQVSWPTSLSDALEWAAWNLASEASAYAMAAEDTGSPGKIMQKAPQWTPDLAKEADTEITVHVMRVEHGRVTSAVAMNTMGHGAAHPSEASATMTWLLDAKRPLRADDVFAAGDAWKKLVAQACWNAIKAAGQGKDLYPQVKGPDAKELQQVIADVGNWTLEHDGLHISYPEYAVAPRIAQLDDSVIPWAALQPVLSKEFVAP